MRNPFANHGLRRCQLIRYAPWHSGSARRRGEPSSTSTSPSHLKCTDMSSLQRRISRNCVYQMRVRRFTSSRLSCVSPAKMTAPHDPLPGHHRYAEPVMAPAPADDSTPPLPRRGLLDRNWQNALVLLLTVLSGFALLWVLWQMVSSIATTF